MIRGLTRPLSLACFFILALGVAPTSARADEGDSQPIARFSTAEVQPWAYRGPEGKPRGLLIDLIDRLRERTGLRIKNQLRPHSRAILELKEGTADLSILFETQETEAFAESLGNVVTMQILLVTRAGNGPFASLDAFGGKPVGYIRGTYYTKAFNEHPEIEHFPVRDMQQGLELLQRGRITAMVGTDRAVLDGLADSALSREDIEVALVLGQARGNLYFSDRSPHPELKKYFRRAVAEMAEAGELKEIFWVPGLPLVLERTGDGLR